MGDAMNVFVGARVCRGVDWKWGRQVRIFVTKRHFGGFCDFQPEIGKESDFLD